MVDSGWILLFMVLVRVSTFFVLVPFMSFRNIPTLLKVGTAALVSFLVFNTLSPETFEIPGGPVSFFYLAAGEAVVGLILGFCVFLAFASIRIAGQFIDLKMGLLMASVFDPQYGSPVTLTGQFYYYLALVYFFIINGHHNLLATLAASFRLVPVGLHLFREPLMWGILDFFFWMFLLAFQVALPVTGVLLLVDISMGLIGKTMPQLQVFILGMPVKIGAAMLTIIFLLPLMGGILEMVFSRMVTDMLNLMGRF